MSSCCTPALQTDIQGKKVRIGGIAKGSGMIHPNMATLLSVITTDANVDQGLWDSILLHGVQKSFNQVSILCPDQVNKIVLHVLSKDITTRLFGYGSGWLTIRL